MPSKEITDDLELLLRVMPPHIRDSLHRQADFKNLIRDRKIVSFYETEQTRQLEYVCQWIRSRRCIS